MPKKVAPVPKGYRTITPSLIVRGADEALNFYADVFGAEILSRMYADDGLTVLNAEIKIGNSLVVLSDELPLFNLYSPLAYGGAGVTQHIYSADVDNIWQRSVDAGCSIIVALADTPYGERYGKLVDPFGHVWSMSKRIAKVKPAVIKAQAEEVGFVVQETTPVDGLNVTPAVESSPIEAETVAA